MTSLAGTRRGTKRSAQILEFVKAYIDLNGYAPTRREIGKACHLSTSVVSYQLAILQEAGHLTVAREKARGIVLNREMNEADWKVVNEMAKVAR